MVQRIFADPRLSEAEIEQAGKRDTGRFPVAPSSREMREARQLFRNIHALLLHGLPEDLVERLLYWSPRVMSATLDRLEQLAAEGASLDAKIGEVSMVVRYGVVAFLPSTHDSRRERPKLVPLPRQAERLPQPGEFDDGPTTLLIDLSDFENKS